MAIVREARWAASRITDPPPVTTDGHRSAKIPEHTFPDLKMGVGLALRPR